ncbi:NAD(P)-binding domain-containing protein [bacterium]|nr:NAD(P)-binding domain-containing protein [bacterium]
MKIGILGTGMVAQSLAPKLVELGHDVLLGTRDVKESLARTGTNGWGHPEFGDWHKQNSHIKVGTFADAAVHGELVMNACSGHGSLPALKAAGANNLNGKILVDISNPLDFSNGFPPSLFVGNTDSLGEQIQREYPSVKVVKTLNTVNAMLMTNPNMLGGGDHTIFVSGNDAQAKEAVIDFLKSQFGWRDVIDFGDITNARATESYLHLWIRMFGQFQNPMVTIKVLK